MSVLRSRKFVSSVVIVILVALASTPVLDKTVDLAGMQTTNQKSKAYLQDWTDQALATAATAAVMNAGLSVIEDSELQVAPAGFGASIALGDVVRPVNDTVSRLVSIALASAVALQIQKTLIDVGAEIGIKWFLTWSMVCLLATLWLDWPPLRRLAWGFFVLALVARFLIPGAVFLNGTIGDQFTERAHAQTQAQFERLTAETTKTKSNVIRIVSAKDGSLNPFTRFNEVRKQLSVLLASLANMRGAIGRAAVDLAAVFIVQTILMPLLTLWGLIKLLGYLLSPAGMDSVWFFSLLRGSEKPVGRSPQIAEAVGETQR